MKRLPIVMLALVFAAAVLSRAGWAGDDLARLMRAEAAKKGFVCLEREAHNTIVPGNFNHDAVPDVAAIVYRPLAKGKFESDTPARIWVGSYLDGRFRIIFDWTEGVFHPEEPAGAAFPGGPDSGLANERGREGDRLTYYVRGGSNWRWGHEIAFGSRNGKIVPVGASQEWYWTLADTLDETTADYATGKVVYRYRRQPLDDTASHPVEEGRMSYYRIVPGEADAIRIDGQIDNEWANVPWVKVESDDEMVIFGRNKWSGPADLSFRLKALLKRADLYLLVDVTDDQVVLNPSPGIKQDHIEFWLDRRLSILSTDLDMDYNSHMYRRDGKGLAQYAVFQTGVRQLYPRNAPEPRIESKMLLTPGGYRVEMRIPLAAFLEMPLADYRRVGFTLCVSDTDSKSAPAQDTVMATSTLKRGDAFTLGSIFLEDRLLPPLYGEGY